MLGSLTPTKNEAWVVGFTGIVNSNYFDMCCYYDQNSADNTIEIISQLPNTLLRLNESADYNEGQRQIELIQIAREFDCEYFMALDADEALLGSADAFKAEIASLDPGTSVYYEWINITPDGKHLWSAGFKRFGFVDDGTEHLPAVLHSERVPQGRSSFYSDGIKVIHLQYLNRSRFFLKHIEYLEREFELNGCLSKIDLFRKYSHMLFAKTQPVDSQSNLATLIGSFRCNDSNTNANGILEIKDNRFIRELVAHDEWILLHLITRLGHFVGHDVDIRPRLNLGRKSIVLLLEFLLRHANAFFSRAAMRVLKIYLR